MATIFKLIIEDDEGKTTVYPLSQGEISIGRKDGNTIRLMERNVSRRHARLMRANGSIFIEDLDSYNGIRINGERINGRYEVKEGDLVEIGDYHLALQAADIEDEASPPPQRQDRGDRDVLREEWPAQGTVPDFRLPEEILGVRGAQQVHARSQSVPRDTIVDTPIQPAPMPPALVPLSPPRSPPFGFGSSTASDGTPSSTRDPLVGPASRSQDGEPTPRTLPPFPMSGGLTLGSSPYTTASRPSPTADLDPRPPQLRPAAPLQLKKDSDNLPTVPLAVGPVRVSAVPRLVCVSTLYAGKEFPLTRPELIIGRVEDNDIVIEHRSVSRNHAKIVFDGRTHKIIDLQSANGILVNGEEYAMTDLRRSDLIELGHVRFRFVPAGEAFVPTEDELREMRDAGVAAPGGASEPPTLRPVESNYPPLYAPLAPAALAAAPLSGGRQTPAGFKAPEPGSEVPTFDPSTAATVTDTPLSALAMGQMLTPQIESPSSAPTLPSPRRSEPQPAERSPRSDTAAPRQPLPSYDPRPSDQRPTSVNINHRPNGTANGVAAPPTDGAEPVTQSSVAIEPLIEESEPKSRLAFLITAVVVALALIGLVFVLYKGHDGSNDRILEDLVKRGANRQALEFYKAKSVDHEFKDEAKALDLARRAFEAETERNEIERARQNPQPTNPEAEPRTPPAADERGSIAPLPAGDAIPEGEAADDDGHDGPSSDPTRARNRAAVRRSAANKAAPAARTKAPPPNTNQQKAKELAERGRVALIAGDLNKAEEQLTKCVKLAPIPDCYRNLGILYGHADDSEKAIYNYREYLKLKPNASDADKLRALIGEPAPSPKTKN